MNAIGSARCAGLALAVLVVALSAATPVRAQTGTTAASAPTAPLMRDQLERRLQSTATLVDASSGARQIESSGNADAKAQLGKARELHTQAKAALDGGDLAGADKLLRAVARTMVDAVNAASADQVRARKDRADFDARRESTLALLGAAKRVAAEKGAAARYADVTRRIETLIASADQQAAGGKLGEARQTLDQAYGATRAALATLRGGDTLVRELNFASKEEEFGYEIDRNDTHRMLVTVLLQDRRGGSVDAMVERALADSARLRKQADEQAQRREFEAGVKSLEESTRELQRAIRGAGVYIPG